MTQTPWEVVQALVTYQLPCSTGEVDHCSPVVLKLKYPAVKVATKDAKAEPSRVREYEDYHLLEVTMHASPDRVAHLLSQT